MMFLSRRREEKGATAVLVALMSVVIFGAAALAVDFSSLAMERQKLHDHIDSAAHAGAFMLPGDGAGAAAAARNIAQAQDSDIDPDVQLFCVIASLGASNLPNTAQIPSTCYPGPPPYTAGSYPGMRCNEVICAIPCPASSTTKCNTVRASEDKTVDFGFGDIIGTPTGNTGSVASAACKGSCGTETPNPMNIVFMADRTTSMSDSNREMMKTAILDSLKQMTPSMHYVAFGALHKSDPHWSCATRATGYNRHWSDAQNIKAGTWVPLEFTDDYLTSSETPTLNTSNALVQGIQCLPDSNVGGDWRYGTYGTHLAGALKGAVRYLLGYGGNNLGSLPSDRPGTVKPVVIFETDGMPDEILDEGSTSLTNSGDIGAGLQSGSSSNGREGCNNFKQVAANAKAAGVTVITIGFGDATTARCRKGSTSSSYERVRDVLASAASNHPGTGLPSAANSCSNATSRYEENNDGDYFFCAAQGSELSDIFATAFNTVSDSIKLIRLP